MRSTFSAAMTAFFAVAVIAFSGCKKDKDGDDKTPPDYNPVTTGSTWTYQPNMGASYTLTATDRDTTAMARTYKVFTSTNGINQYRSKSGSDYYRYGLVPGLGAQGFEELYLKDNQEVNAIWQATQNFNYPGLLIPLVATLKYTIKEKGITKNVSGNNFSDVIHIRLDIAVSGFGSVGGGDFYYAAGVGLIESSLLITAQGQVVGNATEVLTSYNIK
jgi:hypothetical protein